MEISFGELRCKEVVSVSDGKKLGRIIDLSLDLNGRVLGLILPQSGRVFKAIADKNCLFVPWRNICSIGDDIIMVNLEGRRLLGN